MRKLGLVLCLLAVVSIAGGAAGYYVLMEPTPIFHSPRYVTVRRGETMRAVAARLRSTGVVRSAIATTLYSEAIGTGRRIQPGQYAFKGGENTPQVVRHLVNGDSLVITLVIPEGVTLHQIAERVEQAGLGCDTDFERAARHGPIPRALGLGPSGAEGYLFPATYRFSPEATTQDVLFAMLARFYRVITPQVEQRGFQTGLSIREVVTLASIVEKEAKVSGERPRIAGVFYNRLRLRMPLQSDPTAQYSLDGDPVAAVVAVHSPSPFNTYDFVGLPPGPIASPGLASIEAVLYPEHTEYLYFVARKDGTHVFSRTLAQQERAIAKLRRITAEQSRNDPSTRPRHRR
jgi:peptidoglycan lytic transglycosylase G